MSSHEALQKVRARLEAWGEWSRSGAGTGLGYPRVAAHMAAASGAYGQREVLVQPPGVAETDSALGVLSQAHPIMYDVINEEYYWQSTIAAGARRLKISERTYKSRRLMAEYWLDSRLNFVDVPESC